MQSFAFGLHGFFIHAVQKLGLSQSFNDARGFPSIQFNGNPVEALKHAQIAVELNQWKSPGIIETLAESQFLNGMYKEAVETERKALQLDPDSKDFKKNLKRYQDALKKNRKS